MYNVSSINAIIRAIFPSKWSGERKYRIAFSPYGRRPKGPQRPILVFVIVIVSWLRQKTPSEHWKYPISCFYFREVYKNHLTQN